MFSRVSVELKDFAFRARPAPMKLPMPLRGETAPCGSGNYLIHGKRVCGQGQTAALLITGQRTAEVTLLLSDLRFAYVTEKSGIGRTAARVRCARFTEAQVSIHSEPDFVRVGIVLAIVFPPADWAQGKRVRRLQRLVSATRAPVFLNR